MLTIYLDLYIMAQKFRLRELRLKSEFSDRSGLVTENMTSTTPDKVVGTIFKAVLVDENGEFVVGKVGWAYTSRIHLDSGTLETGKIYPSYNGSFTAADAYVSAELPAGTTTLTLSEIKAILHQDVARTDIVLDLTKNGTSFQTLTMPTGTSTLTIANTTTFADGDKFAVVVTTWVASSIVGAEIFISYTLS